MDYRTIAEKWASFYVEYDYYDFHDNLEVGEGFDDAVDKIEQTLQAPQALELLVKELMRIFREGELEPETRDKILDLMGDIHKGTSENVSRYPVEFELTDKFLKDERKNNDPMHEAKCFIDLYCFCEFEDSSADYSDLSKIGVAYTTSEDDQHEIQAYVNLADCQVEIYVDNFPAKIEKYNSIEEMNSVALPNLDFDTLVYEAQAIIDEHEDFFDTHKISYGLVVGELLKRDSKVTLQNIIDGIKEYETSITPRFNPREAEGSPESIATYIEVANGERKEWMLPIAKEGQLVRQPAVQMDRAEAGFDRE